MGNDIPLSALQHYIYCPRQCALIHVERLWAENLHAASGTLEHERVDEGKGNHESGVRMERSVHLLSCEHGIQGVADLVEYHPEKGGNMRIVPVEYKHGKPKEHRADEVQLCSQALCLEKMHETEIENGYLFYLKTRRRLDVLYQLQLESTINIPSFPWWERGHGENVQSLAEGVVACFDLTPCGGAANT